MRARRTGALLLAFGCLLMLGTACENVFFDIESVELAESFDLGTDLGPVDGGNNGGMDAGDADIPDDADVDFVADMDTGTDMPADAGDDVGDTGEDVGMDVGVDMGMDMGGGACDRDFPEDPNACDPVARQDCNMGSICNVVFDPVNTRLFLACANPSSGTGMVGDPCTGTSSCLKELSCVNWSLQGPDPRSRSCSKFCIMETGEGCEEDEFCTMALDDLEGVGFCTPKCDPYVADSCSNATCSPDFNYPDYTCNPEFRCLRNNGSSAKGLGESCDEANIADNCESGLVCYPVNGSKECVEPCQSDADCTTGTCGAPMGNWELRYCQ